MREVERGDGRKDLTYDDITNEMRVWHIDVTPEL